MHGGSLSLSRLSFLVVHGQRPPPPGSTPHADDERATGRTTSVLLVRFALSPPSSKSACGASTPCRETGCRGRERESEKRARDICDLNTVSCDRITSVRGAAAPLSLSTFHAYMASQWPGGNLCCVFWHHPVQRPDKKSRKFGICRPRGFAFKMEGSGGRKPACLACAPRGGEAAFYII